jgi:hypothetical protein
MKRKASAEWKGNLKEGTGTISTETRTFARNNTDAATAGLIPPEFTYAVFERCMEYAVGVHWGK